MIFLDLISNFINELRLTSFSIPQITFSTFLDIFLVAFFIYKILVWVKETRAWSLLKGIILILIISVLSYVFKLYTVSFIISYTLNTGILAIIVLFTPEIRKALEELGTKNVNMFFTGQSEQRQISAQSIDSILRALHKMSEDRIGALIVLENKVAIKDISETGIPIDATITSQLLINIFEDKTPLHDGAVIIRDNRIVSASCILPLTNIEIGKELGTRHRAGVGMSENADSYVLIVSEETGSISLAHNGKLYKDICDDEIKKMIRFNTLNPKTPTKKKKSIWKGMK